MLNNADSHMVEEQYQTSKNLEARMRLHKLFSTNSYGWFRWVLDQISLTAGGNLLELGAGTGALWRENLGRLPAGVRLTLTDLSAGMVGKEWESLGADRRFWFARVDAQAIPFPTAHFDLVIANHFLYHVPDRARAIAEIRRVLKPGGKLYAATNGERHVVEINELSARLARKYLPAQNKEQVGLWTKTFTLENGVEQLSQSFAQVICQRYPDGFRVTQAQPLVNYVLSLLSSMRGAIPESEIRRLTVSLEEEIRQRGEIWITKDSGILIAS